MTSHCCSAVPAQDLVEAVGPPLETSAPGTSSRSSELSEVGAMLQSISAQAAGKSICIICGRKASKANFQALS